MARHYIALLGQDGKLQDNQIPSPEKLGVAPGLKDRNYPDCFYRMVDGIKEWINPPMMPGVEYRTTERHDGRPVFAQIFDAGGFDVPGKSKAFYLDKVNRADNIVSATATVSGYVVPTDMYGGYFDESNVGTKIRLSVAAGRDSGLYVFKATPPGGQNFSASGKRVMVYAKYTKVGDK